MHVFAPTSRFELKTATAKRTSEPLDVITLVEDPSDLITAPAFILD
jgi:hypothetical protein